MNIIITGASRGIGASLVSEFDVSDNKLALISKSGNLSYPPNNSQYLNIAKDIADISNIKELTDNIIKEFGHIDLLINNAGIGLFKELTDFSIEDFHSQMNANLSQAFLFTQLISKHFKSRNNGVIVNINSVASIKTFKYSSIYSASKAALLAMSRSLREETRDFGIKIVDIILGATETDIWSAESREQFANRMLKPIDVAHTIKNIVEISRERDIYIEEITLRPQLGDL